MGLIFVCMDNLSACSVTIRVLIFISTFVSDSELEDNALLCCCHLWKILYVRIRNRRLYMCL